MERKKLTGGAHSKEKLHAIEKEKHDEEGNGCAQRQAKGLHRVQCLDICEFERGKKETKSVQLFHRVQEGMIAGTNTCFWWTGRSRDSC